MSPFLQEELSPVRAPVSRILEIRLKFKHTNGPNNFIVSSCAKASPVPQCTLDEAQAVNESGKTTAAKLCEVPASPHHCQLRSCPQEIRPC